MNCSSGIGVAFAAAVLQRQVVHREVDALAARARAPAGRAAASAPPASTIASKSRRSSSAGDVDADVARRSGTSTPFGRHQVEAAVEDALLQLELGNAVAQQAADAVGALEDRDGVAGAVELLAPRPGRPGPSRRPRPACRCATRGGCGVTQPSSNARSMIDTSIALIVTGSLLMPSTHDAFARRRAEPAGELGEVVGRVQPIDRRLPAVAVDEVVPVGNQVAERAALMAERDAAVHAARALIARAPARDTAGRPRASRWTARRPAASACFLRAISMKPVGLPIDRHPDQLLERRRRARPLGARLACAASTRL